MKNLNKILVFTGLLSSSTVIAQELPVLSGPYGNLVVPDLDIDQVQTEVAMMAIRKPEFKFTPAYIYSDGTDIYGGTLGKSFNLDQKGALTLDARFLKISPDTGSNLDEWRFRAIYGLPLQSDRFIAALVAEHKALDDIYDQNSFLFSGSYALSRNMLATFNAGWKDRDYDAGAGDDSEFASGIGLLSVLGEKVKLSIDYQFEDDIAGEDNYSATLIFSSNFSVGAGKNETYYMAYSVPF